MLCHIGQILFAAYLYALTLNELPVLFQAAPFTVRDGFVHLLDLLFPSHALLQQCLLCWGKSPVTISRKRIQ